MFLYLTKGYLELTNQTLIIKPPFGKKQVFELKNIESIKYRRPKLIFFFVLRDLILFKYELVISSVDKEYVVRFLYGYKNKSLFLEELEKQLGKNIEGKEILKEIL